MEQQPSLFSSDDLQSMLDFMPFAKLLNIQAISLSKQEAKAKIKVREDMTTTGGLLHGGAAMAIADAVAACLSILFLPEGSRTTTVESKTNFFKGAKVGTEIICISKPLHIGKSFIVLQSELVDANNPMKKLSQITQTQAILTSNL
jgi:1,4-dihydroxy-2-naphthoyl-CoA hydrolase